MADNWTMKRSVYLLLAALAFTSCSDPQVRLETGHMQMPSYPPLARDARITGRVPVVIEIETNGSVVSAKATAGHPLLRQEAESTARQWHFQVLHKTKEPLIRRTIVFDFELAGDPASVSTPPRIILHLPESIQIIAPPGPLWNAVPHHTFQSV